MPEDKETELPEDMQPGIRPDFSLKALEEEDEASGQASGSEEPANSGYSSKSGAAASIGALKSAEETAKTPGVTSHGQDSSSSGGESSSLYNPKDSPRFKRIQQVLTSGGGRRGALIGGGVAGGTTIVILIISFSGFFSSLGLINLRENALGNSNGIVNRALQNRRNKNLGVVLKKLSVGDFEGSINKPKMKNSLERYGFKVTFDDDGKGKLTDFEYTSSKGETRALNLNAEDFNTEANRFFEGNLGQEARTAVKNSLKYDAATWRGKAAIRLWESMGVNFSNWLGRKPSEKAVTPKEQLADDLRNADDVKTQGGITREGGKPTDDLTDKDAKGNPIPGNEATDATSSIDGASQYAQQLQADPTIGDSGTTALGSRLVDSSDDLIGEAGGALTTTALAKDSTASMQSLLAKMATKFPGLAAQGAVKGISATAWVQTACRVRGTLNFVANTRNVLLSAELARFAVKFMVAADNQKAGLLNSQGLNILMLYAQSPNPANGRGYLQSGGIRYMMGDKTARVSDANISRYSVGRANVGVLGQITSFVDAVPLANNRTACRIVNNGLIQIGGFGIGAAFAIFGGGETGISEFIDGTTIGLTIAQELVFQIGTPLLIKTGAHMVFNGFENGEMVGDGLASGIGALQGMNAGANGLKPITKTKAAVLQKQVDQDKKFAMSKQSIAERYFGRNNPNSLLAKMAVVFPAGISSFVSSLVHYQASLFAPSGLFGSLARFTMPGRVQAATINDQCNGDEQITKYDIATDPFCNPVMADTPNLDIPQTETILKQNGQIDAQDNPVAGKEFANYISDCFRGRTGILYNANPKQDGTDSGAADNTCVESGIPLSGDSVGQNDRFAAYYGYMTDRDNIVQEVNGDFANASP